MSTTSSPGEEFEGPELGPTSTPSTYGNSRVILVSTTTPQEDLIDSEHSGTGDQGSGREEDATSEQDLGPSKEGLYNTDTRFTQRRY